MTSDNADDIWGEMNAVDQEEVTGVFVNLAKSIAAFERTIVTHQTPFDSFILALKADHHAVPRFGINEQRGLKIFIGSGRCITCHYGPLFSDGEFHNLQLPQTGPEPPKDAGRYEGIRLLLSSPMNMNSRFADSNGATITADRDLRYLSAKPEFWGQFKTPSLRGLRGRGRFMHNGIFGSLEEVVDFYSTLRGQTQSGHHDEQVLRPLNLSEDQKQDLLSFLNSLNE